MIRDKVKLGIIYWFILLLIAPLISNGQDFLIEKDLRLDWTFYSNAQDEVLPFLDHNSESPYAIHLNTSVDFGKETYLKIEIPENTSLFIDNRFIEHYQAKSVKLYSIDSLQRAINKNMLYLTLYRRGGFITPPPISIGFLHNSFDTAMNVNPINSRNIDGREDFLKIIILVVFTFFVVLYTLIPAELMDFYSIGDLMTFRFTDTYLTKFRSITKSQTVVIIYQAAMLASIMIISLHYYNNPIGEKFIMRMNPVFGWVVVFLITLVLIFLKYILISIVSQLFGITDRINFYFIEYMRMAMLFYSIIFVVLSYMVINHFYSLTSLLNTLIIIVILFNFIRLAIIYFKLQRNIPIKNLHLFSYLCTTELIPIVIGLNFFVK